MRRYTEWLWGMVTEGEVLDGQSVSNKLDGCYGRQRVFQRDVWKNEKKKDEEGKRDKVMPQFLFLSLLAVSGYLQPKERKISEVFPKK